jgi:isocitrate dehydrogenase (NAD+)
MPPRLIRETAGALQLTARHIEKYPTCGPIRLSIFDLIVNRKEYKMDYMKAFEALVEQQLARVEKMKSDTDFIDYKALDKIVIGVIGGDGIGPAITAQAHRILEHLLAGEVKTGKVEFRVIDGCTIENRAAAGKAIPDDVLVEIKKCNVLLKGPMVTPRATDPWPNLISANTLLRRSLDLFAAVHD